MARKASGGLVTFAIINLLVALAPMCAGCFGLTATFGDGHLNLNGREVGPQFKQHVDRNVPSARAESVISLAMSGLFCLLLLSGSVGLFFAQTWARWLTIAAAVLLILALCVHDVYQLAIYRPAVMDFLDQQMPPGPNLAGFKIGFTASYFFWSCSNPVIILYLLGMSLFLLLTKAFDAPLEKFRQRLREDEDEEDEDEEDDY